VLESQISLGPNLRAKPEPLPARAAEPERNVAAAASTAPARHRAETPAPGTPYAKELRLLQYVLEHATPGDPVSVCEQIERFGEEVLTQYGQWLKVAGAQKATVLASALRDVPRGGSVLEIGAYCGYSAIRMSLALPGVRIVTLEVDPAHMVIARNVVAFAGRAHMIDVWTGHSKDLLPRLPARYGGVEHFKLSAVFMDQRGSRYDEDLAVLERMGLLLPDAVIIADNVLKPGSPLFLWRLLSSDAYDTHIVRVREFAMPSEDWMSVSKLRVPPPAPEGDPAEAAAAVPSGALASCDGPEDLVQLQWESDRVRAQATRPGQGVSFAEWSSFADGMKERLRKWGIAATVDASSLEEGLQLFPRPLAAPGALRARWEPLP